MRPERRHRLGILGRIKTAGRRLAGTVIAPLYDSLRSRGTAGLIHLSSGSTGKPKAILHDLASLLPPRKEGRGNSRPTILLLLLFDYIGGINTLISVLFSGGMAVVAT